VRATYAAHLAMFLGVDALIYAFRDRLLTGDLGTSILTMAAAAPLMVASIALRRALSRKMSFRTIMGVPDLAGTPADESFVCEGIYARMRHPRCVQIYLGVAAGVLFANYLSGYALLLASACSLLAVVRFEECELRTRFGAAYSEYCERVPRFWPW
jgi:protein-S-isoprenylcysteine O-methyltransferase Ste14